MTGNRSCQCLTLDDEFSSLKIGLVIPFSHISYGLCTVSAVFGHPLAELVQILTTVLDAARLLWQCEASEAEWLAQDPVARICSTVDFLWIMRRNN